MTVEINTDSIRIYDGVTEVVGWHQDEWLQDPETVVPAIANAILLATTNPDRLIDMLTMFKN